MAAVYLTAAGGPALGAVLAVPAAVIVAMYLHAVLQGHPTTDPAIAQRLAEALTRIGCVEQVGVVAQSQISEPCTLRRTTPSKIVAALGFVRESDDDVLDGVAAMQLTLLRDARCRRIYLLWFIVALGFAVGGSVVAGLIAGRHHASTAAVASLGASFWLYVAAHAWVSRIQGASAWARIDRIARTLTPDPIAVPRALRAIATWRTEAEAERSTTARILFAALQPVRARWFELERAQALEAQV